MKWIEDHPFSAGQGLQKSSFTYFHACSKDQADVLSIQDTGVELFREDGSAWSGLCDLTGTKMDVSWPFIVSFLDVQ